MSTSITLQFLGSTPFETIGHLDTALRQPLAAAAPFTLSLCELGVFPSEKRPRVIWIGLGAGQSCSD